MRELLLACAVVLVGAPFAYLLHEVTSHGPFTRWDTSAAQSLHGRVVHDGGAIAALKFVSFTGKPVFLAAVVGIPVVWLLVRQARKLALFLVVVSIGGSLIDTGVKLAVSRPRPTFSDPIMTAYGKSFPSGHAMSSLVCYGAVLLVVLPLVATRWRWLAVAAVAVWVAAIGFSRLALGVHYISDVLGGYVLGAAWLIGSVAIFEVWREDRGRRRTQPLTEGVEPDEATAATGD
ncbi:MAG TPA: phosphatase PAP2 family protein [Acidimicrobiales bacterium]|nr:phosphatase PAP2 family protein [Acidimicrobiales bacterium]